MKSVAVLPDLWSALRRFGRRRSRGGVGAGPRSRGAAWRWLGAGAFAAGVVLFATGPPPRAAAPAPVLGKHGVVVSAEAHATRAGHAILEAGGNAIDAAVAVSFALGVTEPYHSGLGGGGFLLIRTAAGDIAALDARETAPAAASRDMYTAPGVAEDASRRGALAVAVPGLLAGLASALERYGTMRLDEVMAPAIELAEEGFPIGWRHARALRRWRERGLAERFPETAQIQLPPSGGEIEPGWRLVQKDLAATLRKIAAAGPELFYRGELGATLAAGVRARGGILSAQDLAAYRPVWREPLRGSYRGFEIVSFPPPSSGGVALLTMLNVLEPFPLRETEAGSSLSIHRAAEAMKLAFADRATHLADSDFVPVPVTELTAKAYGRSLAERLRADAVIAVEGPGLPVSADPAGGAGDVSPDDADGGTTHFSITDGRGNAVAVTQTINLLFGSGLTVPGTGIVLNDEMDDFSIAPNRPNAFGLVDTRGVNAVEPGKRPLSSMTPTLVLREGALHAVLGSPGGPRIISSVLISLLGILDWGADVSTAVAAPRFHHQWRPDRLFLEPEIPRDVREGLAARGHAVEVAGRHWSSVQAIAVDLETGDHWGASDPRSDGLALGLAHPPPAAAAPPP